MAYSIREVLAVALAFVVVIFAIGADSDKLFGGCGINVSGIQSCLPAVAKRNATVSLSCCKVFKSINLSCMCLFPVELPKIGIDPFFVANIVSGCGIPAPLFCLR